MRFFDWFKFKTRPSEKTEGLTSELKENEEASSPIMQERKAVDFTMPVSEDDRDLVAAIVTTIVANNQPDSSFRIQSIREVDKELEEAAAIVAAIAASDRPDSHFFLKNIKRIH